MVESIGVGVESVGISLGLSFALVQHTESRCVGWVGISRVGVSSIGSSVWEPVGIVVEESWISLSICLSICITLHKPMILSVWEGGRVVVGQWETSRIGDSLGRHNRLDGNSRLDGWVDIWGAKLGSQMLSLGNLDSMGVIWNHSS